MKLDKEMLERIVKCAVMYNGRELTFDKKFLELYDDVELEVEDNGDHFIVRGTPICEKL